MHSLNCANCGAPLEVGPAARFATCAHCNTSLEIKRSDSAAWTELIQQVAAETGQIREELEALRIEQEIERLDREWEKEREDYLISGNDGSKSEPSVGMAVGITIFVVLGALFGISILASQNARSSHIFPPGTSFSIGPAASEGGNALPVCFFMVLLLIGGGYSAIRVLGKAQDLNDRETAHYEQREKLKRRLRRRE